MHSTSDVVRQLQLGNPARTITEDRIRHAIRSGQVAAPPTFAGRYVWSDEAVKEIARALGLITPRGGEVHGE